MLIEALLLPERGSQRLIEIKSFGAEAPAVPFDGLYSHGLFERPFAPRSRDDAQRLADWLDAAYDIGDARGWSDGFEPIDLRVAGDRQAFRMGLGMPSELDGSAWLEVCVPARLRFMPASDDDALRLREWLRRAYDF